MARTMGRASTKCLLFAKVVKKNESPKLFNYFLVLIPFCTDYRWGSLLAGQGRVSRFLVVQGGGIVQRNPPVLPAKTTS